jgi:hypothetical protein
MLPYHPGRENIEKTCLLSINVYNQTFKTINRAIYAPYYRMTSSKKGWCSSYEDAPVKRKYYGIKGS